MQKSTHRQVDVREFINRFNLNTIQGRTVVLVFLSLFLFFTLSIIVYLQNQQTFRISRDVEHLEIPLALAASSLSSGLDKVTASQEAYIMSGDESSRRERTLTWEKEIYVALEILKQLSSESNSKADRQKVQEIEALLKDFKNVQDKVDKYFLDNRRAFNYEGISTDSVNAIAIEQLAQYNQDRKTQKKMVEMLGNEATPIRQKIANTIQPLIQTQQSLLKKEVSLIQENIKKTNLTIVVLGTLAIILIGGISYSLILTLRRSISSPVSLLNKLAVGEIDQKKYETKDELNAIVKAGLQLAENLKKASEFALKVGDGKFDLVFQPASEHDILGNALIQMQKQLQLAAIEEKKRAWATESMSKFVEILRKDHASFKHMIDEIIATLVHILAINQGGIFIVNEEDTDNTYLEMISCYAYSKKRFFEKKIPIKGKFASGVIGQAYIEKQTINLSEVPSNYTHITSGLGEATPTALLIVPLKLNNRVTGIIELAGFKEFDNQEIAFVEKLAETLASSIIATKINEQTKKLLHDSQQQGQILLHKEEEMRKNLEELRITQNEMQRTQKELLDVKDDLEREMQKQQIAMQELQTKEATLEAMINNTDDVIIVIDKEYKILLFNEIYSKNLNIRMGMEARQGLDILTTYLPEQVEVFKSYFDRCLAGEKFAVEEKLLFVGEERYYEIHYNPIKDDKNNITGVSVFTRNITGRKAQEKKVLETIQQEKERANKQIEAQRKLFEQSIVLFREKEKSLVQKLSNLENELTSLKNEAKIY
jgi:PAS domain S-box-containing protein